MYKEYKVVSVTPAGRKRYADLLARHLLAQRPLIDEHHWWLNTTNQDDISYFQGLAAKYPDFFKLIHPFTRPPCGNLSIYQFFRRTIDPGTIYIRYDDDVVWLKKDSVAEILYSRYAERNPLLVFGNIINNAVCTHLHQRFGVVPTNSVKVSYQATCQTGWNTPLVAEWVHRQFLNSSEGSASWLGEKYKAFAKWVLWDCVRFSINNFAWFGSDFAKFEGNVGQDEEMSLSSELPRAFNRPNIICGQSVVAHFAYEPQRHHMDTTDILSKYEALAPEWPS